MRALAHYLFAAVILTVYGGQVCPFIASLPLFYWAMQMALAFGLAFALRWTLLGPVVTRAPFPRQVTRQFGLDAGLFLALGVVVLVFDMITWGFPWASGLKVVLACATLGLFVGTDLALERERRLSAEMTRQGRNLVVAPKFLPLTAKFVLATSFCVLFVAGIVLLLVSRDLDWVNQGAGDPQLALRAVLVEVIFVAATFLAEAINLIISFSKNLKLSFARQNRVLRAVTGGDLSGQVPVTTNDEFGVMAAHTNLMIAALDQRGQELARTQDATILSLASLAETRDLETGGHILRTQGYVRTLALRLRQSGYHSDYLSDARIELLFKCAPLHDIGKVGVPDAILLKPGRLDPEEWEEMKRHTIYGRDALRSAAKVLGGSSYISLAQEIAYTHHEKWDGSGYPEGLSGRGIPLAGRLMAVADVYDALISPRVYKKAFSHDKARDIILNGQGRHFDPHLVDAFLQTEEAFVQIARQYADHEYQKMSA